MENIFVCGKMEFYVSLLWLKNFLDQRSRLGWNLRGFALFMIFLCGILQEKEGG
jgi:hypothetical protein